VLGKPPGGTAPGMLPKSGKDNSPKNEIAITQKLNHVLGDIDVVFEILNEKKNVLHLWIFNFSRQTSVLKFHEIIQIALFVEWRLNPS
jgi:hypothetical protein